ncbi:hypothetical protein [Salinisphaera sp. T31B1]|uniref:hypothetical protein n=1 Tax=Salinisphaera sp. T31B1 TaxID=727963 RepID=UPI00333F92D0
MNSPDRQVRDNARGQGSASTGKAVRTSRLLDIVLWSLWLVIMWGFLITLAMTDSPHDVPGMHELIITGYFFGFAAIFALIYLIVLKRG